MSQLQHAKPFTPAGLFARKAVAALTLLSAVGCAFFVMTADSRAEQLFIVSIALLLAFLFIVQYMSLSPVSEEVLGTELLDVCRDPQEAQTFLKEAARQSRGLTCAEVRLLVTQSNAHWADLKL